MTAANRCLFNVDDYQRKRQGLQSPWPEWRSLNEHDHFANQQLKDYPGILQASPFIPGTWRHSLSLSKKLNRIAELTRENLHHEQQIGNPEMFSVL